MDTKDMILELRTKMGLSQDELAEKVFVTRQAVSRWENGETTPNIETLKLLSKLFDVSINTLLGSPRQLICQCCGMPLADGDISRETDGFFNEEYCKWCYADGEYMYHDLDDLIEVCVQNRAREEFPAEQARAYLKNTLPKLNYWKRYENLGGAEAFAQYKQTLMDEFNDLHIDGMPKVEKLNALSRRICAETPDPSVAAQWLDETLKGRRHYSVPVYYLGNFCAAAGFCPVFGGTLRDSLFAGLLGLIIGFVSRQMDRRETNPFFSTIVEAFAMAVPASLPRIRSHTIWTLRGEMRTYLR